MAEAGKEAQYYRREKDRFICLLCPHRCRLAEGQAGLCRVRRVEGDRLKTLNYGTCAAASIDPIEKKPFYHFYPGWEILSLGTFGCNLNCRFCQNWQLVRQGCSCSSPLEPAEAVSLLERQEPSRRLGIAYTYAEPTVWFEFVLETARLIHERGHCNLLVTNGFIAAEPLRELLAYIDGMNIDVKGFTSEFYRRWCGGRKEPVLKTVEQAVKHCHVEITYLIIPTLNDDSGELERFVSWLAGIDREIPLHFSRYFPHREVELSPTPVETLTRAYEIAAKKLDYVYLGNLGETTYNHTYCPCCRALLLRRRGYHTVNEGLGEENRCRRCGHKIPLVGSVGPQPSGRSTTRT